MSKRQIGRIASSSGPINRIQQLAQIAFGREVTRKVIDPILPLNDSGNGLPFYCVHPITGAATEFRFLAEMLGSGQTFYGIQTPTAKRNVAFPRTIEAVSRYYVSRLIEFQPSGPLLLGGYSVGAAIALEMAQQLRALGREVPLLVVLDGELFNTGADISKLNPLYWMKLFFNIPAWIRDFLMVEFTFRSFCRAVMLKSLQLAKPITARFLGTKSGHAVEAFIDLSRCTPDHAAFMKELFDNQFNYCPTGYPGQVVVCVAKTHALTHLNQVEACWRKIAPRVDVATFRATHTSLIRPPDGLDVAEYLAKAFVEVTVSELGRRAA